MIQVDLSNIWGALSLPELLGIEKEISEAHTALTEGTGAGAEYRGWLELPVRRDPRELLRILRAAEQIRSDSDVCVVLGMDGSCLGARAAMELLQGANRNMGRGKGDPQIFFAGDNLSTRQWKELLRLLEGKDVSVIVISGSGTDLEPAIALRNLRWMLERRYGTDESSRRIYAVTDPEAGVLQQMAADKGWECFALPSDAPDAFGVLSPAGLLPMAVAGIDIMELLSGAADAAEQYNLRSFENPVWMYTAVRNLMYRMGRKTELFVSFEPDFRSMGRWWQQLFAGAQGLFPAPAEFPAELDSLAHSVPGGDQNLLETLVRFAPPAQPCTIGSDALDPDRLNYLADQDLYAVEEATFQTAVACHADRGIPVITMDCGELKDRTVGELFFFLQLCCAVSAYTLGVTPFCRPGGERFRAERFCALGRPDLEP